MSEEWETELRRLVGELVLAAHETILHGDPMNEYALRIAVILHAKSLIPLCNEMGESLEATQAPLDLYNAYGWPDRAGVRRTVKAALAKWKESK